MRNYPQTLRSGSRSSCGSKRAPYATRGNLAENLVSRVERDADPKVVAQLREKIEGVMADHASRLGCANQHLQAKGAFERCAAGKRGARRLATYQGLNRFRTSLPSLTVHDFMEQRRRRTWDLGEYDIDLATLRRRAGVSPGTTSSRC